MNLQVFNKNGKYATYLKVNKIANKSYQKTKTVNVKLGKLIKS